MCGEALWQVRSGTALAIYRITAYERQISTPLKLQQQYRSLYLFIPHDANNVFLKPTCTS